MTARLRFSGPSGEYEIVAESPRGFAEDTAMIVAINGTTTRWFIETSETDAAGASVVSGMTGDGSGLWFALILGPKPHIEYWGDRILVRADHSID